MDTAAVTAARVPYALPGRKDRKGHKAPQVRKVPRVFLVPKDQLARKVLRVLPVSKGQKDRKVLRAFPDPRGQKGRKVLRAFPGLKGQKARKVLRAFPGPKDRRVLPVLLLRSVYYLPTPPPPKACHPAVPWNLTAMA